MGRSPDPFLSRPNIKEEKAVRLRETIIVMRGNVSAAILKGAMILSIVWKLKLYGQRIEGGEHTGVFRA